MRAGSPVKVIYITGYGRSGSTLLDIALSQHPDVFGAGEVTALTRHVWENGEFCACRSNVHECSVWRSVVDEWNCDSDPDVIRSYRSAQQRSESIFSWARLVPKRVSRTRRIYADQTARLFGALRSVAGRPVIVDSSKLPGRGFALAQNPSIELYVVHLVRDGRAVAWSMMQPFKRQVQSGLQKELRPKWLIYTAIRWTIVNLAAQVLCWKLGARRSIRVRYESFVEDPVGTVGQVMRLVGEKEVGAEHADSRVVSPHHQVAGSRHRMLHSLTIQANEQWRIKMARSKQILFSALCAPLMARYGYMASAPMNKRSREALAS